MRKRMVCTLIASLFILQGCSVISVETISRSESTVTSEIFAEVSFESPVSETEVISEEPVPTAEEPVVDVSESDVTEVVTDTEPEVPDTPVYPETFAFNDVFGEFNVVEFRSDWPLNSYDKSCFVREGDSMYYRGDDKFTSRLGIDVSHHQKGKIDWQKVADSGVEFVIVRVGYRGYGLNSGWIKEDEYAASYIKGALDAGLEVGTYFFSQAINDEEALEEAEFVIDFFKRNNFTAEEITLPVVFDPEHILDADARTDGVSGEQFNRNTRIFCNAIREAGFQPMIYSNMGWEAYILDLKALSDIPVWYADYEPAPQTPYDFVMWQYSEKIHVPGISGDMDGDILLVPVE